MNRLQRLEILIGEEKIKKLQNHKVMIFGLGGVGGFVVETIVRSGVGEVVLVDFDIIEKDNYNRQIIATDNCLGQTKGEAFLKRIKSINPECKVTLVSKFILPDNLNNLDFSDLDFIVDAIDTISTKLAIIKKAKELEIPIISSMGFGNKLDVTKIQITDITKTEMCPLAKVIRNELKKQRINKVKVAYSKEKPLIPLVKIFKENNKVVVGSYLPVVAIAGIMIGDYVVKELINEK